MSLFLVVVLVIAALAVYAAFTGQQCLNDAESKEGIYEALK